MNKKIEYAEVRADIADLVLYSTNITNHADTCIMNIQFLDHLDKAGRLHQKYAEFDFSSVETKYTHFADKFNNAINQIETAKEKFVKKCDCGYKSK